MNSHLDGSRRPLGWVGGAVAVATAAALAVLLRSRRRPRMQTPPRMGRFFLSDEVAVATGQPDEEECARLAADGFRAALDLRLDGEGGQKLTPSDECEMLTRYGVAYAHFPIPTEPLDDVLLTRFRHEIAGLPKPVLVHCATGKRSGTLALMHHAIDRGLNGEQMLLCAEEAGVLYGPAEFRRRIADFVDRQRSTSRTTPLSPLYGNGV